MAETKHSDEMPFTKLVREAEEANAKQQAEAEAKAQEVPGWVREPSPAQEPLGEAPLIKLMVEQEAAVARDFAEGRITEADYQSFRELSETKIEEFQSHLQEKGESIVDGLKEWAPDAVGAIEQLKEKHPDFIDELDSGHPKLAVVADTLETVQAVVEPLAGQMIDGVDELVEVIGTDLPDLAQSFVDARKEMEGVDAAEVEAAQEKLDTVSAEWNAKFEEIDANLDVAREKMEADFDKFELAVDEMQAKAEANPDAEVITQIHEAQIDDVIEEETGIVDA